jgi:DNA-binding transcriptional MerR regulator
MRPTARSASAERSTNPVPTMTAEANWSTIGDIARDFDVTLRTLRFYEARGLLAPRREGMNRFYSDQDRSRLELILKGKRLGFTLTEIRAMVGQISETRSGLKLSLPQVDEQLKLLRSQLEECKAAIDELESQRAVLMVG